jgi:hypothetical protein
MGHPRAACHNPPMHARRAVRPPRARHFPAPVAFVVACLLVVAGCGPLVPQPIQSPSPSSSAFPSGPSASPSGSPAGSASPTADAATVDATIEQQVIALRGLQPKSTIAPQMLDDQQI